MKEQFVCRAAVLAILASLACATTARGQVTALEIVSHPAPTDVLPGYVVNDLSIDFNGQYNGSLMVVTLTRGSIYQHEPLGGNFPPPAALVDAVPALEWDTFLANGGPTVEETIGDFGTGGSPHPGPTFKFDSESIDATWFPAGGNSILDRSGFMVARVTLSEDAVGAFRYVASADQVIGVGGEDEILLPIRRGVIGIPEPATAVLFGLGVVSLLVVKRRRPSGEVFSPEGTALHEPRVERREP